jgi:hypothetical protein
LRGGPRGFRPRFTCTAVLRCDSRESMEFRVRGLYPLRREVPLASATRCFCNSPTRLWPDHESSYNTAPATPTGYRSGAVWAVPVSLATTQGIEFLSFPQATKMFQFACLPPLRLWIQRRVPAVSRRWVSPFGNPRINARSAAPRGLSQPSTSFIGSWCQGIHRVPLFS